MAILKTFPALQTQRLILTEFRKKDAGAIAELANNPNISSVTIRMPYPYHKKDALNFIDLAHEAFLGESGYLFAIRLKTDNSFIGGMGIHLDKESNIAEIGYWIGEPYWNKGYASEALTEISKFGFEKLGLQKLHAHCFGANYASAKVLEKAGFTKEGILRQHLLKDGVYKDLIYYGLLSTEFKPANPTI